MKCPNCGQKMESKTKLEPFYHWEDECEYWTPHTTHTCSKCNITHKMGKWNIPQDLLPTEKQKKTVKFICNRLSGLWIEDAGMTKHSHWEFINKYFEDAKNAPEVNIWENDPDAYDWWGPEEWYC